MEERKRTEEEPRKTRDQLESQIRERTFALISANKALEEEITERKQIEERLHYLSSRLLEIQEAERRNVALDLHDSISSSLAGIKMALEVKLSNTLKGEGRSESITLEEIIDMVKRCMSECNRIQRHLRPAALDLLGLPPAIRSLCREFETTYHIKINPIMELDKVKVSEELKIVIYRICQEALNNVAKHSGGDSVTLCLRHEDGNIHLMIEDNGNGFEANKALSPRKSRKSMGLYGMKERCKLSGGTFFLQSQRGEGTTVSALWPCE